MGNKILGVFVAITTFFGSIFGSGGGTVTPTPPIDNPGNVIDVSQPTAQMIEIAGYEITVDEASSIIDGFDMFAGDLGAGGDVEARREIILSKTYTDGETKNMVVYNFTDKSYYTVPAELLNRYLEDDNFRKLGAPVTEMNTFNMSGRSSGGIITDGKYTAQIYEKGVLVMTRTGVVDIYVGAVEMNGDTVKLHPLLEDQDLLVKQKHGMDKLGNVDGEMHPLKEVVFNSSDGEYNLYANYSSCCVYLELNKDYSVKTALVNAGKNYILNSVNEYELSILPMECISVDDMIKDGSEPIEEDALKYYKQLKADGTADDVIAKFRTAYEELYNSGFVPGYRCSRIKMWTYMVLDLRFGDGTTGFDDVGTLGRERMTCLVYNPKQDKVFAVSDIFFSMWKEDEGLGRNALGYPESNVMYNKKIGNTTFKEIQIYQNGYVYLTDEGTYRAELGYVYDSTGNAFIPAPTPIVPDRFGAEVSRVTKNGVVYINYEKGAIKCELTFNKTQYRYTFYRGRQFNMESGNFEAKLLPMNSLVDLDSLSCEGTMPTAPNGLPVSFKKTIKPKLIAKYTELYNNGYFCGFPEEVFKGAWNNVFAQQFVSSDSNSVIFGEERPYVSALVYNPKTDEVYLMRDAVIKTWQSVYATAGSPTSDEYQIDGYDIWFQTFDFGMTIRHGNLIVFTEEFESPEAYIQEMNENPLTTPTHERNEQKGYIA